MPRARPAIGNHEPHAEACRDRIEEEIIRAYVRLALTSDQANGHRTVTFAQFDGLEVRLTEILLGDHPVMIPPFWLEVYSHATDSVVDSCGCYEFDEDELGKAVELVFEARSCQSRPN
jgi:hypothetical protein